MSAATDGGADLTPAVIAIDVGNSKTDIALVSRAGNVVSALRGPTSSHQQVGPEVGFTRLVSLVDEAARRAGIPAAVGPMADILVYCAAGADLPSDVRLLQRGLRLTGLASASIVVNDCYGGLRAGTSRGWGVCVVCGSGMNCLGLAPNHRVARFDALGEISGDWGGGGAIGQAGLAAAVRAQDGRGPKTVLEASVPRHFGLVHPRALTGAFYRATIPFARHHEIAPLVFAAAREGDAVARGIVDRVADEVVAWATAAIRRLQLQRRDPDVILAGGVFMADDSKFYDRIRAGITAVAPAARVQRLGVPPIVWATLLGLDRIHGMPAPPAVESRIRSALTTGRLSAGRSAGVS